MKRNMLNFVGFAVFGALACGAVDLYAAVAPNPRNTSSRTNTTTDSHAVQRSAADVARTTAPRSTADAGTNGRVSARGAIMSRAMRGTQTVDVKPQNISRSATNARSGVVQVGAAHTDSSTGASRASMARATAVFNDISKIGGGYAQCREAYATCMDQFCANANDTYRRCFCSSRFTDFRDTEAALDQAKTLLMEFEDNNLNAVDKTAAEVNAMYTATAGEAAIKRDTSAAAKMLSQVEDLLSGKTKVSSKSTYGSLGILSIDLTDDIDDVWGNGGSSVFGASGTNLADLEGVSLYNASNKQCSSIVSGSCDSNAIFQMARSSYSIMITQDCNAYEKKINSMRESVKQTVRTAEKYLREARLEEYRTHNSADVNECIARVKTAITADTACGPDYKRCLDYTGVYINQTTGEPIYSTRLFELDKLITLGGVDSNADVLRQNNNFDKFLDSKRMYAATALDTCRDMANTVWNEFKRTALIEIAQAQDEKIEQVKMSCVDTMNQCYDTQSSALRDFDTTTAQYAGAVSAVAARDMCKDKVLACAALYGDTTNCSFDAKGKLVGDNGCGLASLIKFVDSVDTTRISEGCETALENYAERLCTDTSSSRGYPWNCRLLSRDNIINNLKNVSAVGEYCYNNTELTIEANKIIENLTDRIISEIRVMMKSECEKVGGAFTEQSSKTDYVSKFYINVYGSSEPGSVASDYGVCIQNNVRNQCDIQDTLTGGNGYAVYNYTKDSCELSEEWYKYKCESEFDGIWENNVCYIKE